MEGKTIVVGMMDRKSGKVAASVVPAETADVVPAWPGGIVGEDAAVCPVIRIPFSEITVGRKPINRAVSFLVERCSIDRITHISPLESFTGAGRIGGPSLEGCLLFSLFTGKVFPLAVDQTVYRGSEEHGQFVTGARREALPVFRAKIRQLRRHRPGKFHRGSGNYGLSLSLNREADPDMTAMSLVMVSLPSIRRCRRRRRSTPTITSTTAIRSTSCLLSWLRMGLSCGMMAAASMTSFLRQRPCSS